MQRKSLFLFVSLALVAAQTARSTTITVTSLADGGNGSLRSALASAVDGDTIDATGVSGTILLTSGELLVTSDLTVLGPGPGSLTLDGNFSSRLFYVGSGASANISGLTLANGLNDFGGGIFNEGTLVINNSALTGNIGFVGGGIYNDFLGTVSIERSVLIDNSVDYAGGGVYNSGVASIKNSTLNGNVAGNGGGAVCSTGTLQIKNSTVSENIAFNFGGAVEVDEGDVTINNSIIALNFALFSTDISGSFTGSFNFIGGNPMLGPLADNGGPTMTRALLDSSPCINSGDPGFAGLPDFDQRGPGFPRVAGGRIDIGAFEVPFEDGDSDGDGVPDSADECADTAPGEVVNLTGCSIAQLVPCEGPQSGGTWKNHGQYVRAVVEAANAFLKAGRITYKQSEEIVSNAAHSDCGSKKAGK